MRGDISTGVKSLATRSPSPRDVVSRDYPEQVPRSGVLEEPSGSLAMGLLGGCDKPHESQSKDTQS
jgi:hypothetical protein